MTLPADTIRNCRGISCSRRWHVQGNQILTFCKSVSREIEKSEGLW